MSSILPDLPRARVLVVDDETINTLILKEILVEAHEVVTVHGGKEALDACEKAIPDLILLDVMMPDMNGHELCRRLKADPRTAEVPVIFVTAQNDPREEAAGFAVGAVDFISKPINAPVVQARVHTHLALKRQGDFLRTLAFLDGLTGIANRRQFDDRLPVEWRGCLRHGHPLSVILMDIDHFKNYNDHYGHQAGDDCLRDFGALLLSSTGRAHDLVARYGGEEFICVLPNSPLEGAVHLAEKIRERLQELTWPHANSPTAPYVTLSAGVSCVIPVEDLGSSELVAAADRQLYLAKTAGRNRICSRDMNVKLRPSKGVST